MPFSPLSPRFIRRAVFALPLCCTVLFASLYLGGCRSQSHEENIELRVYEVPKGTANSLVTTIKDVMWLGENKITGRAVVTPDGRLAVLATPSVQTGVQTLIDQVAKSSVASEQQTIELHYFLVLGKPATSPQPYPANASEIKAGLDEIVRTQGPQTLRLHSACALVAER